MTNQPHNTQGLDEILQRFYRNTGDQGMDKEWVLVCHTHEVRALIDWHNKRVEAYHNELTDNDKKVWIYADDLEKRKAKAVEEVLDRLDKYLKDEISIRPRNAIEAERNKLKETKSVSE